MKIHCIQHVPFETPAFIQTWAEKRGHHINIQPINNNTEFPKQEDFDFLVVMGGPMSVHDEDQFPWLLEEKAFIQTAVRHHKYILGICLGAQILAETLGEQVIKNPQKEIGWFPISKTMDKKHKILDALPDRFTAFHWHGETFSIPENMFSIGQSEACQNQGFFNNHILALQFHLESTRESVQSLIENCGDELVQGKYIQKIDVILKESDKYMNKSNLILESLLDNFLRKQGNGLTILKNPLSEKNYPQKTPKKGGWF